MRGPMFSLPTVMFLGVIFFILIFFLFIFVQVGMVTIAFSKLGLTPAQGFMLLIATLLGSGVNIPVFRTERLVPDVTVRRIRMFNPHAGYNFSEKGKSLTNQVVAVNLGGCVIPVLLSMSLMGDMVWIFRFCCALQS